MRQLLKWAVPVLVVTALIVLGQVFEIPYIPAITFIGAVLVVLTFVVIGICNLFKKKSK